MKSRRTFIRSATGAVLAGAIPAGFNDAFSGTRDNTETTSEFSYCLNTATIRGQKLGLLGDIEIAAKAGYDGVELWLNDIQHYLAQGGSRKVLKRKLRDCGLKLENVIAFSKWIVDDPGIRDNALKDLTESFELVAGLEGKRIAAPPTGAIRGKVLDLFDVAERYRTILETGEEYGVTPVLELWGHSVNLYSLSQAVFVITESKHPNACMLPDVYHMYRGGSGFSGLRLLSKSAVSMFHLNDYPAHVAGKDLTDADRVFPGDGVAPFHSMVKELKRINPNMALSLELFNPEYWKMDALTAARTGLQKIKKITEKTG